MFQQNLEQNAPACSLLDLPNELLLLLAPELDEDSLWHLAETCRRMNFLLTPLVFMRLGVDVPPSFSGALHSLDLTGDHLKLSRIVRRATVLTSVNVIDCALVYSSGFTGANPDGIFEAVAAANSLANRLSHLGHLRLYPSAKSAALRGRELFAVAALLNSVSRRGDSCITIYSMINNENLTDPPPFIHTFKAVPRTPGPPSRGAPDDIPSAPADLPVVRLQSTERIGMVGLPLVSDSSLTTLNIHSSFLLHANFYKWSLHLLNTSPLTSLSLANIDLSASDWTLILPALTIPTLASLTMGPRGVSIVMPDLDMFLTRHPSIQMLDLSFHHPFGAHSLHSTTCVLPRLATLRATPAYLLYFLGGANAQGWYPDLQLVAVTWNDESAFGEAQFARVVGCIETRRVVPCVELIGKLANRCQVPAHLISPTT